MFEKCLLILPALLLMAQALHAADPKRPNIVFIMSDDHANKAISAYGSDLLQTPHLDRLASEGMLFNNAFCTNSICGPSRAVILTGKYSHLNGFLVNETTRFDGSQTTFPKLFQEAGYDTAVIGKWHLGTEPTGFDYWDVLPGQGEYYDPEFIKMGERSTHEGYATEIIAEKSVEWLRNRDSDKPFVLLSQHKAPHSSFNPSPKYRHHFDDHTFPEPENLFDDYEGRSEGASVSDMRIDPHLILQYQWDEKLHIPEGLVGKERTRWLYQWYMRRYMACVLSVDDAVGSVLDVLPFLRVPRMALRKAPLRRAHRPLQAQYGDSPELAREMVERYPYGSRPEWGRYSDLEPHGDLDGWRAAQERSSPKE